MDTELRGFILWTWRILTTLDVDDARRWEKTIQAVLANRPVMSRDDAEAAVRFVVKAETETRPTSNGAN